MHLWKGDKKLGRALSPPSFEQNPKEQQHFFGMSSLITNIKEVIFTVLILRHSPKMVFCPILWPDSISEQARRRWFRQIGHDGAGRLRWEMITALLLECLKLAPLRTFGENLWKYCWSQFFIIILTLYPPHFLLQNSEKWKESINYKDSLQKFW